MDPNEKHASIKSVLVFRGENMDVIEFRWWKEEGPGYCWIEEDAIGVEPAILKGVRRAEKMS